MSSVSAARDVVLFRTTIYWSVSDYECIIVRFFAGYHDQIGRAEIFRIFEDLSFDGSLPMLAYERNGEIDWSRVNCEDMWLPYSCKTGELLPLPSDETRLKRRRGPHGTYLDNYCLRFGGVSTVPWRSLESFVIMDYCRRRFIDIQTSKRSQNSVVVDRGHDDVSDINQTAGLVAKDDQLRASVGALTANNSTLVTEMSVLEALLAKEKSESDSLRSVNTVLASRID